MKIGIYGRVFKKEFAHRVQQLYNALFDHQIEYATEELFLAQCVANGIKVKHTETFTDATDVKQNEIDFLIVFGGDGTILDTLVYIHKHPIPVFGINTGRLGFLAGDNTDSAFDLIDQIIRGHYTIDERSCLQLISGQKMFNGANFALNDFVIHKKDSSAMITIHTYLNGEFLNSYWSDGLIISTPTGSTGYSLSCGGPILYPGSSSVLITPIAPHNLNVRPMVISDNNVITFEIEGRNTSFLISLDSRSEAISSTFQLAVKKADFMFKIARMNKENYLQTLRNKLMWGVDNRNI